MAERYLGQQGFQVLEPHERCQLAINLRSCKYVLVLLQASEGEQVGWSKPTIISEDPTIYVWLQKIEAAMQTSLAELLLKAITDMETLDIQEQQEDFTAWIEQFPAQIDVLSMQVSWSSKVEECLKKGS